MNFFIVYMLVWFIMISFCAYFNFKYRWFTQVDFDKSPLSDEPLLQLLFIVLFPITGAIILFFCLPKIILPKDKL